jgi:hypothetical protein
MIPRRTIFKLFTLSVLAAPVMRAQPTGPTVIPIALTDFKFAPSTVNLRSHKSYLLRLTKYRIHRPRSRRAQVLYCQRDICRLNQKGP